MDLFSPQSPSPLNNFQQLHPAPPSSNFTMSSTAQMPPQHRILFEQQISHPVSDDHHSSHTISPDSSFHHEREHSMGSWERQPIPVRSSGTRVANAPSTDYMHAYTQEVQNNIRLKAENETLRFALVQLCSAVPELLQVTNPLPLNLNLPLPTSATISSPSDPSFTPTLQSAPLSRLRLIACPDLATLNQKDYPHVNYWKKEQWTAKLKHDTSITDPNQSPRKKGALKAREGINVRMLYVEEENGNMIDGFRAKAIREFAKRIFQELLAHNLAPATWGQATMTALKYFLSEMAYQFTELRLCANGWKASQIAIDNYPSWQQGRRKRTGSCVKKEEDVVSGDEAPANDASTPPPLKDTDRKRSAEESHLPVVANKKRKVQQTAAYPESARIIILDPLNDVVPNTEQQDGCTLIASSSAAPPIVPSAVHHPATPKSTLPESSGPTMDKGDMLVPPVPSTNDIDETSGASQMLGNIPSQGALALVNGSTTSTDQISSKSQNKRNGRFVAGKAITPRNICGRDWAADNPDGTTKMFSDYWDGLSKAAKAEYKKRVETIKSKSKMTAHSSSSAAAETAAAED
ncbi:hypothetical protein HETIRDRAFT_417053 [Heterobasidion irregulare TC 32-1]|uniref:Uncharacterized protein n=1 Tax=Heterobasidion irregulare (strain TC 32-1) TaxID=747525 RepID=W4KB70_HETIT|nr:uncharacterized protein HETIRDRAFT_417053 [Heterobasidion irregulare TC 32-1]ETW83048.1 hypothetical protein HETIRDRAFT_417053 [Heterobasidion irregulare TC 32-1]